MLLSEIGAYLSAILAQWQSGSLQAIPDDESRLARICGGEAFPQAVRAKFKSIIIEDKPYLRNNRLARIWEKQKTAHDAQSTGGKQAGKPPTKRRSNLLANPDKNPEPITQNSERENGERRGARGTSLILPEGLSNHPAVILYWRRFHPEEIPPIGTQDKIERVIGSDLVGWAAVFDFWQDNNYRPESIGKMLDKYAEDKIKGPSRLKDLTPQGNPRITAPG